MSSALKELAALVRHESGNEPERMQNTALSAATLALLLVAADPLVAVMGPWVVNDEARVRLIAASANLGLEFELEPGWHVYWKNSGDAGYAPRIDFSGTPAVRDAHLLFPTPKRFDLPGGLVSFGYETQVIYPIEANLGAAFAKATAVRARLDYLVCREECIPHTAELTLDLPAPGTDTDPETPEITARLAAARAALPQDPAVVPGAPQVTLRVEPGPASSLTLELVAAGGSLDAASPDLFFETHPFFALERPAFSASAAGLRFRVPFRPLDETKPMPATTTFAWTLTGLERNSRSDASPRPVALAGSATVDIPHLRTSGAPSAAGSATQLWIAAGTGVMALALFLLHRFRRSS